MIATVISEAPIQVQIESWPLIQIFLALLCAALIAFAATPIVRVFAYKIGAVDVPKDDRRMHKKPMPLLGGLAIFSGVTVAAAIFCEYKPELIAAWVGGLIITLLGIFDDKHSLSPWVKLLGQTAAALVAIFFGGVSISHINLFGHYIQFGWLSIPITVIWIVGMTNAINLIDGLDGLACGVSAISSASLFLVTLLHADLSVAMMTAVITGACLGFLPYNMNPAKIFMGDTGALFLGYMLSVLSIIGFFKTTAVVSFLIPIIIFGYPLFDTAFAFIRRVVAGRSPFSADRGHLHHRMVDLGLSVKQSVSVLYCICSLLGILAIMLCERRGAASLIILVVAVVIAFFNFVLLKNKQTRELSGITEENQPSEEEASTPTEGKEAQDDTNKSDT